MTHDNDKMFSQQNAWLNNWFNPFSWTYLVMRTTFQPFWFWKNVSSHFSDHQKAQRLLVRAVLGVLFLWLCALGLEWVIGLIIPEIREYSTFSWWINSILVVGGTVLCALLLQTTYDHQKAVICTSVISVFILAYMFMLVASIGIVWAARIFSVADISIVGVLSINIPFISSIGLYFMLVGVLEQRKLGKETTVSKKLLVSGQYTPLIILWLTFIAGAQCWNLLFRQGLDVFVVYLVGYVLIAVCVNIVGTILALLISVRNIHAFSEYQRQ